MRVEGFECDAEGCHAKSNGDIADWFSVLRNDGDAVEIVRLSEQPGSPERWQHACGEECCLKLAAKAMRGLPRE